jgi:hypothetical protein
LVFHIIISIFRSRKLPPETPTSGGRLNRFGVPTIWKIGASKEAPVQPTIFEDTDYTAAKKE